MAAIKAEKKFCGYQHVEAENRHDVDASIAIDLAIKYIRRA